MNRGLFGGCGSDCTWILVLIIVYLGCCCNN